MFNEYDLSKEQLEWFAERFDESPTGLVIIPSYVLNKFRRLTGSEDCNSVLKNKLLCLVDYTFFR